jgi:DNA-binding NarL/FixJ family response regulator
MIMNSNAPIRILAADDHPLLRAGIATLIGTERDMRLVAEAATGREAVERFRDVRPDVTLLDIQMPETSGIDALIAIRSEFPSAKVIILTTYGGDVLAHRALKAGAYAYVLKGLVRRELLDTIRAVHLGQKRIHPGVATELAAHLGEEPLSEREIAVLRLAATGNSNREIGVQLSITEHTAKSHMKKIIAKLGANDRTHAVILALDRGILTGVIPPLG